MTKAELNKRKRVTIYPGQYYVTRENLTISTLLGSCVSACIYDPVAKVAGMNHFLLSSRGANADGPLCHTQAGRYGIHAMELLINEMLKLGARRANLKAKVFGGGAVLKGSTGPDSFLGVGEVNSRFVQEFLAEEGIPLVTRDLGGTRGRVIYFQSDDYSVLLRGVRNLSETQLIQRDRQFWLDSLKKQEKEKESGGVELWG